MKYIFILLLSFTFATEITTREFVLDIVAGEIEVISNRLTYCNVIF